MLSSTPRLILKGGPLQISRPHPSLFGSLLFVTLSYDLQMPQSSGLPRCIFSIQGICELHRGSLSLCTMAWELSQGSTLGDISGYTLPSLKGTVLCCLKYSVLQTSMPYSLFLFWSFQSRITLVPVLHVGQEYQSYASFSFCYFFPLQRCCVSKITLTLLQGHDLTQQSICGLFCRVISFYT